MIFEYALEPEMVATWGDIHNSRIFFYEFGLEQGRLVSPYPKKWARMVWDAFNGRSEMDRKRLEELLARLNETVVKRKNIHWSPSNCDWIDNALVEHSRHPFHAIVARIVPQNVSGVIELAAILSATSAAWAAPHGVVVNRTANEMTAAVGSLLTRCRWVKLVDPYISRATPRHSNSLREFFDMLDRSRPLAPVESIEIHTGEGATGEFLQDFYANIIPKGMKVSLYKWRKKEGGPRFHNRFDGRVSLISGLEGEAIITSILRWQNDQGMRMRQEYGTFLIQSNGNVRQNPEQFSKWLKSAAIDGLQNTLSCSDRKKIYSTGKKAMHQRLSEVSNIDRPPRRKFPSGNRGAVVISA